MKEYWNNLTSGGKAKLVTKVILGILVLLFAIMNWQSTTISVVFFKLNVPLTVLILFFIGVGFGLASIFDYRKFKVKDSEIKQLKSKLDGLNTSNPSEKQNN